MHDGVNKFCCADIKMGCWPSTEEQSTQDNFTLDQSNIPLLTENCVPHSMDSLQGTSPTRDSRLDSLLMKLDHAKSWGRDISSKTQLENCRANILEVFKASTLEMTRLIKEGKRDACDDIVDAILKVKLAIGKERFEATRINVFGRERSTFGDYVLTAAQYFKPVMLCEEDDSVLKLYFFIVSEAETAKIRLRYYVEHTSLVEEYFGLGLVTNGHMQVRIYGNLCPSYWTIRDDVLSDAQRRLLNTVAENRHVVDHDSNANEATTEY